MSLIQKFHSQLQEKVVKCNDGEFVYTLSVGMNNLGSTCYLNSFIQCFTANLGVTQGLLSIKFTKEEKQNVTSIPAFLELKSTLLKLVLGYSSVLDTYCRRLGNLCQLNLYIGINCWQSISNYNKINSTSKYSPMYIFLLEIFSLSSLLLHSACRFCLLDRRFTRVLLLVLWLQR